MRTVVAGIIATISLVGVTSADARADEPPALHLDPDATSWTPVLSEQELGCGTLLLNAVNNHCGYAWRYGGVVPPEDGSFAECYSGDAEICSVVFGFNQTGTQAGQTMDVYVWADAEGQPGAVTCVVPNVDPGPVAYHPGLSIHAVPVENCCTTGYWWVGYWPNWPGMVQGWFCGEDLDGPGGGCPLTKVAPGIGYPTGWQNVSVIWGPTQAMWIGAEVNACPPVPNERSSWGQIKSLYAGSKSARASL